MPDGGPLRSIGPRVLESRAGVWRVDGAFTLSDRSRYMRGVRVTPWNGYANRVDVKPELDRFASTVERSSPQWLNRCLVRRLLSFLVSLRLRL